MSGGKTKAVAVRAIDTEEARTWASWAMSYHMGTTAAAQATVVNALACAVQLSRAKEGLPHGEFEKWRKKYLPDIPCRTAQRYLQLLDQLQLEDGSKCATVAHLLDVNPTEVSEQQAKRVVAKVSKLLEGRNLQQLYMDFGLVKPRQTKDVKLMKRLPPKTGDAHQDAQALAHIWTEDTLEKLDGARHFKDCISDDDLTALVNAMVTAAAELGVPLAEATGPKE